MHRYQLPADWIEYLDLALPAAGPRLVARWGTQRGPFTVASWDTPDGPPNWRWQKGRPDLAPDGEWLSVFDREAGEVRIIRVGTKTPAFVVAREKRDDNMWTAVAPGGAAVAWKEEARTVVRALPGGEIVASVKTGWAVDFRFSPGGRWLTEVGERMFRVLDRDDGYRVAARFPTARFSHSSSVADVPTAVIDSAGGKVVVWDVSTKTPKAELKPDARPYPLAISSNGQRVLTGHTGGGIALWNATGTRLQLSDWGVEDLIAATFSRDGMRAAVGGTNGQIVVWDLDD